MARIVLLTIILISCRPSNQIGELVNAVQTSTLEDTIWLLTEVNGKVVAVAPGEKSPQVKLFMPDNQVHAYGGCNQLGGTYEKKGKKLSAKLASTKMFCEGKMEIEDGLIQALTATTTYSIEGNHLTLSREGKVVARFQAEAVTYK